MISLLDRWWTTTSTQSFCSGYLGGLTILAVALLVYLPGIASIPPIDRDESRFAQASRQMLESQLLPESKLRDSFHSGGLTIPYVQDKPRLNKPPMAYWLQSSSAGMLSLGDPDKDAIWMYRAPSALCAVLTVISVWRLGCSFLKPRASWLASILLCICPVMVWDAHQARADQPLLMATTLAMWMLWKIWNDQSNQPPCPNRTTTARKPYIAPLILWVSIAIGILTKGPIILLVTVTSVVSMSAITGNWKWLKLTRPCLGIGVLATLLLPWTIAAILHVGWQEYKLIIHDEIIARSLTPKESHGAPPGYHVFISAGLFWPGSLFTLHAFVVALRLPKRDRNAHGTPTRASPSPYNAKQTNLRHARRAVRCIQKWRNRLQRSRKDVFLISWIVPSWIVFELISTKLPHYTLPLYPALALITANSFHTASSKLTLNQLPSGQKLGFNVWYGIGLVACTILPTTLAICCSDQVGVAIGASTSLISASLLVYALRIAKVQSVLYAYIPGILSMIIFVIGTLGFVIPRSETLQLSTNLTNSLSQPAIAGTSYHEDSLIFLTRGRYERLSPHDSQNWQKDNPNGLIVLPSSTPLNQLVDEPVAEVHGFNYTKWRYESHIVVRANPHLDIP